LDNVNDSSVMGYTAWAFLMLCLAWNMGLGSYVSGWLASRRKPPSPPIPRWQPDWTTVEKLGAANYRLRVTRGTESRTVVGYTTFRFTDTGEQCGSALSNRCFHAVEVSLARSFYP
jgi:hypothetical protein